MQPAAVAFDDRVRQLAAHPVERGASDRVLEAGHRWLRGERVPADGITVEQQLLDRILAQAVGIVGVRIAAGEAEDELGHQIAERVTDPSGLPVVDQAAREAVEKTIRALRRLQQNRAPVGTGVRLVEGGDEGRGEEVGKEDSLLCYRVVAQAKASVVGKQCGNRFLPRGGFCVSTKRDRFVNCPG